MNERRSDNTENRLEALYGEAGDVEPDAGLDRIIRARANESVRINRSPIKLPWLGGLVTASVAVAAIAVVLQQAPPGASEPETIGPTELREPEAFMVPSVGAPEASQESASVDRAGNADDNLQSVASSRARSVSSPTSAAPESEAATQHDQSRSERNIEEKVDAAIEPDRERSAEIADDPDRVLTEIRDLIDKGEAGQARELLARLRADHPNYTVPEKIEKALAQPD